MLTAIVGVNWGDEGKGRMVDLLSADYDVVVRYQGGNNAGHTVVNEKGRFILNLLPSGILRDGTVGVMGPGMVIDLEHLYHEVEKIRQGGIQITPERLKISSNATICMPYHKLLDCLEEDRLTDKKFGSTRRGIAPVYADKYMKKTLRMKDLLHPEMLPSKLSDLLEWKNLTVVGGYHSKPITVESMLEWLNTHGMSFSLWFFNPDERLEDLLEVSPSRAGERAGDVFPAGKSWSNIETCPSSSLILIPHLLYDSYLFHKKAGAGTG